MPPATRRCQAFGARSVHGHSLGRGPFGSSEPETGLWAPRPASPNSYRRSRSQGKSAHLLLDTCKTHRVRPIMELCAK